jgi:two-component system response regulator HydG
MARLLIVDDNDAMREGMAVSLARLGHEVRAAKGGAEALAAYRARRADVVVTDLRMSPMDGIALLRALRDRDPDATVVVVTAHGTVPAAVEAIHAGAIDFVEKPFSPELLRAKVEKAAAIAGERKRGREAGARAEALSDDRAREKAGGLVGDSEPMRRVREQIRKVAATDATVLVLGESGTGKELVARAIHAASARRDGPFVTVSCAALPESLLESELFGHEKGSFTGAVKRKLGRFELADGGTLFLDEVAEIPPAVQVKILRVLQERQFERVGGEETIDVSVRLVSATHRDLKRLVAEGRFREDLFYRLHVVPLLLPALRERPGDVPILANHFLQRLAPRVGRRLSGFAPEALAKLERHAWPGNVRELENVIEQALVFAEGELVQPGDLPGVNDGMGALPVPTGDRPLPEILDDLERRILVAAYDRARGVKAETARLLGISPGALYYKLEKYGLAKGDGSGEGGS